MDTRRTEVIDAEFVDSQELVPSNGPAIPGFSAPLPFNLATELQIAKTKLPIHFSMKVVPMETVEKVVQNKPMEDVPRAYNRPAEGQQEQLLSAFLIHLFPAMSQFTSDFRVLDGDDAMLDDQVRQVEENLQGLGMTAQIEKIKSEVQRFKVTRSALKFTHQEGLVRPDTIIPMRYLPDLFMAVPVWFFYAHGEAMDRIGDIKGSNDPAVHPWTEYFCNLFLNNRRWADTFQLYNRRLRTLADYGGEGFDMIPPFLARRLKWAVQAFDFVVIATPYHDLAGSDWQNLAWVRSIDPYVLGFKKGIPYIFVLGRFSDSGTFPLYHQLVGDTIEFLRKNKQVLLAWNGHRPNWYGIPGRKYFETGMAGTHLISHIDELLAAFDRNSLFDWLRMEDSAVTATR